jgi:hypothetical protein
MSPPKQRLMNYQNGSTMLRKFIVNFCGMETQHSRHVKEGWRDWDYRVPHPAHRPCLPRRSLAKAGVGGGRRWAVVQAELLAWTSLAPAQNANIEQSTFNTEHSTALRAFSPEPPHPNPLPRWGEGTDGTSFSLSPSRERAGVRGLQQHQLQLCVSISAKGEQGTGPPSVESLKCRG